MRKGWAILAGVLAVCVWAGPAGAKPSKACLAALKQADTLSIGYQSLDLLRTDLLNNISTALTTNTSFVAALNATTTAIQDATPDIQKTLRSLASAQDDYQAAAKKCRAS